MSEERTTFEPPATALADPNFPTAFELGALEEAIRRGVLDEYNRRIALAVLRKFDAARRTEAELRARLREETATIRSLVETLEKTWDHLPDDHVPEWCSRCDDTSAAIAFGHSALALLSQPPDEAEATCPTCHGYCDEYGGMRRRHGETSRPGGPLHVCLDCTDGTAPDEAESTEGHAFMENCGHMEGADACWLCGRRKAEHPGWVDAPDEAESTEEGT